MKKHDINRWIFEIPLEDIQKPYEDSGHTNTCICCGKKIRQNKYCVHLVNGNLVSTDQPFASDEDMGFYPIGNSCKNQLPNNFYFFMT